MQQAILFRKFNVFSLNDNYYGCPDKKRVMMDVPKQKELINTMDVPVIWPDIFQ